MPSRRHSSAMLASPRTPSTTMRMFSSALVCLRVLRLLSRMIFSDDDVRPVGFCFISTPQVTMNKNAPLNHRYICPIGADGIQVLQHVHSGNTRLGCSRLALRQTQNPILHHHLRRQKRKVPTPTGFVVVVLNEGRDVGFKRTRQGPILQGLMPALVLTPGLGGGRGHRISQPQFCVIGANREQCAKNA